MYASMIFGSGLPQVLFKPSSPSVGLTKRGVLRNTYHKIGNFGDTVDRFLPLLPQWWRWHACRIERRNLLVLFVNQLKHQVSRLRVELLRSVRVDLKE